MIRIKMVVGLLVSAQVLWAAAAKELPNIVLILTDDQGYGDVSFLNPESKIKTPHLDALAAGGVYATDAHSPSSVCSPSRYALMTGRYAWRGVLRKSIVLPWEKPVIEPELDTLPAMLKRAGYTTTMIGKWHLGFEWPWKGGKRPPEEEIIRGVRGIATNSQFDWSKPITGGPWGAGFDHYYGDGTINFPPYGFFEDGYFLEPPVDVTREKGHGNGPGNPDWSYEGVLPELTRRGVEFIRKNAESDQPYFLYFSTTSPHSPHVPTPEFQGKSGLGAYGDFVVQTDDAIGQLMTALKETGQFENTLVIMSSDNGAATYTLSLIRSHGHSPTGPLRGAKGDSLEGGHRVPFIAHWPAGGLSGGRKVDQPLGLIDMYATLAALVGQPVPKGSGEDSLNVWPTLAENKTVRTEHVHHQHSGELGLRMGDWVFLEGNRGRAEKDWLLEIQQIEKIDAPNMLFNLADDFGQRTNLYYTHPEQVQTMQKRLKQITGPRAPLD